MAMGIVSDTDFEQEQEVLQRPVTKSVPIIQPINRGRGNGNVEVPDSLRKVIGETAVSDGRREALQLASGFGISPASASAYANGATSTATYQDTPNKPTIQSAKDRIAKAARGKLRAAIHALTAEKMNEAKAVEISTIAKNMAAVVKQMEPDTSNGSNPTQNNQFILYAPQFRKEEHFDVVYAKE